MARILCLILALALSPVAALAQEVTANPSETPQTLPEPLVPAPGGPVPAYDDPAWESLAARSEAALLAGRASDLTLAGLRAELVTWRGTFQALLGANTPRIRTLEAQLASLGPAPADGASEAPEIAAERDRLTAALAQLQVPILLATESATRADRLIAEIDLLLRQRWVENLSERVSSPLWPVNWGKAWDDSLGGARAIWNESRGEWQNPIRQSALWDVLPGVIFLLALGTVLLLRGRIAVHWLQNRADGWTMRFRGVAGFVLSFGGLLVPLVGIALISGGLQLTGMFGLRGESIVQGLPEIAINVIVARWLIGQLLTERNGRGNPLDLSLEGLTRLRRLFLALAWVLSASVAVTLFVDAGNLPDVSRAVLMLPLGLMGAFFLIRIGRELRHAGQGRAADEGAPRPYRFVLAALLGRLTVLVGYGAILLGVLGYARAFEQVIFASTGTLFLLGALALVQGLVFDVYSAVTRNEDGAKEALVPVLIGFLLAFAALPLLALIWGARASELSELWEQFRAGFQIGGTRISPTNFLMFVTVFAVGYMATRLIQNALRTTVLPKTKMDTGGQNAIVSGFGYVGVFLAALVAITTAGIDLSGLAIVAGALSVGIGFGLQNIVSNFVSGIILLIERPIAEGDWIEVGGQQGYVRNISVRSTRIETFDRTDVIVPNADLVSGTVTNFTRGNTIGRVIVPVGVAYGTDTRRVEEILREIAKAHPMVLLSPPPAVLFRGFGADSLDFEIRAILRDVNWSLSVRSELNHQIAERFVAEGIEIPFAQRDIWLRNPEALRAPAADPTAQDADTKDIPE